VIQTDDLNISNILTFDKLMLKKVYILDVDIFLDIGGAGKASYDIMMGLSNYYKIIFIPKYSVFQKIKDKNDLYIFLDHINKLKNYGIYIDQNFLGYSREKIFSYKDYLSLIFKIIENNSIVMDLNYFPEFEINNLGDVAKSFLHSGEIHFIKHSKNCKIIVLLQTLDNRPVTSHINFALECFLICHFFDSKLFLKSIYHNLKDFISTKRLIKTANLILVYSIGSIISLDKYDHNKKFKVLSIGNIVQSFPRPDHKSNYIIYFARLIYDKGIMDLLEIFYGILKYVNTKLIITGSFQDSQIEKKFFSRAKKYGINKNIEYRGFVDREELKKLIGGAKVFLYPSHYDSFPYAILEAVSSYTAVVTYAIPNIAYSYKDLKCVYKIREFDIKCMAQKTVELLNLSENKYFGLFDKKTTDFIERHTNKNENVKEISKLISEI